MMGYTEFAAIDQALASRMRGLNQAWQPEEREFVWELRVALVLYYASFWNPKETRCST